MMKVNWPSCSHSPKTLSFRHSDDAAAVFKTLNSVYFDSSSSSSSSSDNNNNNKEEDNDIELIVRGARSETTRLFFEPSTGKAISVVPVEEEKKEEPEDMVGPELFKESVVMAMESEDPYVDFKRSMQEMMEANALVKDWGSLEELLAWYLRVNVKENHAYIVAAFVDLLVKFSASSSSGSSTSDGVNSSLNINISSRSTSRSSSSCACVICRRDHRHRQQMVVARKSNSKSTTSFSSAASSFSSSDEPGEQIQDDGLIA